MKRSRNDILNDVMDTENSIVAHRLKISIDSHNVIRYTAELDNYDIGQHKNDTLMYFEQWKLEFYEHYKELTELPILMSLLDNCVIIRWEPQCYVADLKKLYSNHLFISLNDELFIKFDAQRMNFTPVKYDMTVWQPGRPVINLEHGTDMERFGKIASDLCLSVDLMFDVIALCYHTFMFNPHDLVFHHIPNSYSVWLNKIANRFGYLRCRGDVSFYYRTNANSFDDRVIAHHSVPRLEFCKLVFK